MRLSRRALLGGAATAPLWPHLSFAQASDFPAREIHAICPFGPGTGADIVVRYFGQKISELSGKPFITENRAGGQGLIATEAVARAKPDGYTIAITPASSTLAAATHLFKKVPFDPLKDFAPIATISTLSFALMVDPKKGFKTVHDLTKYLKEKGGDRFYASSSNTGTVSAELYRKAIGIDIKRVNYKAGPDAISDMLSGHIDFWFTDASFAVGQVASGKLTCLGVTGPKRTGAMAQIPTLTEMGVPVDLTAWWGAVAPAGTPQPIVDKLAGWILQITNTQETKDFLFKYANDPMPGDAKLVTQLLKRDIERWGEYVKIGEIEQM
jgi:tripartite-type tricarboxylate transporter receptor subunit TctC